MTWDYDFELMTIEVDDIYIDAHRHWEYHYPQLISGYMPNIDVITDNLDGETYFGFVFSSREVKL